MSETLKEACGVVGAYLPDAEAARNIFYCLYALQHRGADGAGIATSSGQEIRAHTGSGLVAQVFKEETVASLNGRLGIGHVLCNAYKAVGTELQPIVASSNGETIAVAHNGNLVNAGVLRETVLNKLTTLSQAEIVAQLLLATPSVSWKKRFAQVMRQLVGSYSLTVLTKDKVFGIRDPLGLKPLCVGQVKTAWVIASETCALDHLEAKNIREVAPGEVVQLDSEGLTSFFPLGESDRQSFCSLEYSYLLRPDSRLGGQSAYSTRFELGVRLAKEHPADADVVIGVPDSATAAAIGYAEASGIPYREGLIKNRYVGHTPVRPNLRIRQVGIGLKFNALGQILAGQRVVVVDDRIVHGYTTAAVNQFLRRSGASEVHMRITTPPTISGCHYGVEIGTRGELIASVKSLPELCAIIGADSLGFLSIEGLNQVTNTEGRACNGCFTGVFPTPTQLELSLPVGVLETVH